MRSALVWLVSLFLSGSAYAQTSVGFQNPNDIRPVLEYHLPSWGYTTWSLNLNLWGQGDDSKYQDKHKYTHSAYNFYFRPAFSRYRESEDDLALLNFSLGTRYYYYGDKTERDNNNQRTRNRGFDLPGNFAGRWNHYIGTKSFCLIDGIFSGHYQESRTKTVHQNGTVFKHKGISKRYATIIKLGIGLGHLRNVTPVIRALRLNERFRALRKGESLSSEDLQSIAEAFAKRSGYSRVYDRLDKYFWRDLLEGLGDIPRLTPFEIYYLADVLNENIGMRWQGWDVSSGLQFTDSRTNYKNDQQTILGWFTQGRWYKNLSLAQQLGLEASGYYGKVLNSGSAQKSEGQFLLKAAFLWTISDRLLWESELASPVSFGRTKKSPSERSEWFWDREYHCDTSFSFFIEDHLSLSTGLNAWWTRKDKELYNPCSSNNWSLHLGLTYYPYRRLM